MHVKKDELQENESEAKEVFARRCRSRYRRMLIPKQDK